MKAKKGFTLIELLAVIVVLTIITLIGFTTMSTYTKKAREDAFRIEATEIVNGVKDAVSLHDINKINIKNDNASCQKSGSDKYCFTIAELIKLGIYDGNSEMFTGKVLANSEDSSYTLYLKKGNEFKIIGGFREDYKNYGTLSLEPWKDEYSSCDCTVDFE